MPEKNNCPECGGKPDAPRCGLIGGADKCPHDLQHCDMDGDCNAITNQDCPDCKTIKHHVLDHPGLDAEKYYQAYCNGCGWCGCSCQLGESKYPAGDSDVHCPLCGSMDID